MNCDLSYNMYMNKKIVLLFLAGIVLVGALVVVSQKNETKIAPANIVSTPSQTSYRAFTQKAYEKALQENKIIFLDFYANWCPICRGEAPELEQGFLQLNNPNVLGFRVNYKDDETDDDEKKLAKEFLISYQHTKVILKNRKEILRDGDVWDKEKVIKTLQSL